MPEVVVIGAGLGGLAAAATLARRGVDVAVVERQPVPGGYAGTFERGGFRFEQSLHLVDAIGPGEPTRVLLDALGAGHLAFEAPEILRRELGPDGTLDVPYGDAFLDAMASRFPRSRRGLEALLAREPPEGRETAEGVVRAAIPDARLFQSIAAFAEGWLGRPLDAMTARELLVPWRSYHARGGGYPEGGSAAITGALVAAIAAGGGAIRCDTGAKRIRATRRRAEAVELESGEVLACKAVISNAPPAVTFRELELPEAYRRRLERLEPSVSCQKIWLGLDAPPEPAPAYDTILSSPRVSVVARGRTLAITELLPAGAERGTDPDLLIARIQREMLPGLTRRIAVRSVATPSTFARYTDHPGGAIYGGTIAGTLGARLPQETPIDRLLLAGAWTRPGAGYSTVLRSGYDAACRLLAGSVLSRRS